MQKQKIIIGADIGGTNTVLGMVDTNYQLLEEQSFSTEPENGINNFIERLVNTINEIKNLNYELQAIGLAAPSANLLSGVIEDSANLKWKKVNLVDLMKKYFNIPIAVLNDANAAAIGEKHFGAAQSMKNFIVLTLGTGLGSGIVVNGNILSGANGLAGELGHVVVKTNGRRCNCGKYGCLETYISANGIRRTVFDLISYYNIDSELNRISFDDLTSKRISELALNNDPIALKTFDFTGEILGQALANTVAYFDPEAIILLGGLAEAGDLLLNPTNFYFDKYLLDIYKGKVRILKSTLQNGKAAILGACNFVMQEMKRSEEFSLYQA